MNRNPKPYFRTKSALGSRGVAAIEFAIVGPFLFALIFGIINLGDLAWTYDTLHEGVIASARYASVATGAALTGISASDITTGTCTSAADIQQQFLARISPPISAPAAPQVAVTWGGSLTPCNIETGNVAISTLPGGWVYLQASYLWEPIGMAGVFPGVTVNVSDIEPVMNAPLS